MKKTQLTELAIIFVAIILAYQGITRLIDFLGVAVMYTSDLVQYQGFQFVLWNIFPPIVYFCAAWLVLRFKTGLAKIFAGNTVETDINLAASSKDLLQIAIIVLALVILLQELTVFISNLVMTETDSAVGELLRMNVYAEIVAPVIKCVLAFLLLFFSRRIVNATVFSSKAP